MNCHFRGRLRLRQVHATTGETLAEETVMFTPENDKDLDDDEDDDSKRDDKDDDDEEDEDDAEIRRERVMLKNLKPSSKYEVRALQLGSSVLPILAR